MFLRRDVAGPSRRHCGQQHGVGAAQIRLKMLTISTDDHGRLVATQRDSSPTVYLDHWALRELSTTPALADRFVAALKQRNGSLALSCPNLIEFCNVTDEHGLRPLTQRSEGSGPGRQESGVTTSSAR